MTERLKVIGKCKRGLCGCNLYDGVKKKQIPAQDKNRSDFTFPFHKDCHCVFVKGGE